MIPQMTVVADLTRSAYWLSLKPGDAVGDCHTFLLLFCCLAHLAPKDYPRSEVSAYGRGLQPHSVNVISLREGLCPTNYNTRPQHERSLERHA